MFRIGFSKKYFTLWKVIEKKDFIEVDGLKITYINKISKFIKNLSFDEDRAKRKSIFEGVENYDIDFSLCNEKKLFEYYSAKSLDELFVEFCEYRNEIVKEILLQNNFVEHKGLIIYPELAKKIKLRKLVIGEMMERDFVKAEIVSNLNRKNEFRFVIKNEVFNGVLKGLSKEMYFENAEYFLPIINGKAKKIKGKTVVMNIENYNEVSHNYEINNIKIL